MTQPLTCPKCQGTMRSYNRSGVQIEQCADCRGIFLDFGELEHISQLESQWSQQPPPPPPPPQQHYGQQPGWGAPPPQHGGYYGGHHRGGFGRRLFFSS